MAAPFWLKHVRTSKPRKFQQLTYYACEGLIALHDDRDQSFAAMTPGDFEERVKALARQVRGLRISTVAHERDLYRLCNRSIPEMHEAIQEARDMGDPSDPRVRAWWARHRNNKSTVRLSAGINPEGYPLLPPLPRGRYTGKTAEIDKVGKLLAGPRARILPKKRPRSGLLLPGDVL